MTGKIFNIQNSGDLVEMQESGFVTEDDFQLLLERYPDLLAGDQINSESPRRWLLITREMGVADHESGSDRWSLDHLFIDQDAIPTLVEVKRSTDTRLRREVVGQVMDYAANAVLHWSLDKIQSEYDRQCERDEVDPESRLMKFIGTDEILDTDEFWQQVKTNLQAGKVRILIVADIIPPELRRIVEFLNSQMDPAEVLAVEIRQYVGGNIKTLVPRVIGQTAEAEIRKGTARNAIKKRPLSDAELQKLATDNGVGEFYSRLTDQLRPLFDSTTNRISCITFNIKIQGSKRLASAILLFPNEVDSNGAIRFGIHVKRLAEKFNLNDAQIIEALPDCEIGWGDPGYRQGNVSQSAGFDDVIQLLHQANDSQPSTD